MFALDVENGRCWALKLSLKKLVKLASSKSKVMLSMFSRARNKQVLVKLLRESMLDGSLGLMDASRLFFKANVIYKQASIERQSVKRRDLKEI